jgi:hypothetical protein
LEVVTPARLEWSLRAAQECERERASLDRHWRLRLERARHDADRAFRQYNAVEPENRLVARRLEHTWDQALLAQRALEEEHHRFQQTQPVQLSAAERTQIESLSAALPTLWNAPQTSVTEKRQVVRLLVQRVVVWAPASSQHAQVELHWTGGVMTEHQVTRSVAAWKQVGDLASLLEQLRQWHVTGWTSRRMAEALNATGRRTPHGKGFTADTVRQLLSRTASTPTSTKKKRKRTQPN